MGVKRITPKNYRKFSDPTSLLSLSLLHCPPLIYPALSPFYTLPSPLPSRVHFIQKGTSRVQNITKCVSNEIFYQNISALKEKQVQKDSPITLLIEDKFFRKAKTYLKHQTEKQLGIIQSEEVKLTKWELM